MKTTFLIEFIGAVLLSVVFCKDFGIKGIWMGIFHSVSAFCNAGFDLMGTVSPFSSLTSYSVQPLINVVVMFLIIVGGIGFLVWEDVKKNKHHIKKYSMQTKVVLSTTLFLILVPAIYFYFAEFGELSQKERIFNSLFQSVTTRTAGFNTIELTKLSDMGQVITIILMLIGGSPGSTAGGMKTTTIAVLVFSAISVFRKKDDDDAISGLTNVYAKCSSCLCLVTSASNWRKLPPAAFLGFANKARPKLVLSSLSFFHAASAFTKF